MSLLCYGFFIFTFAGSGFTTEAQSKKPPPPSTATRAFEDAVAKYVKMEHDLGSSVPTQKTTKEPEQIADRQDQFAGLLANSRQSAKQGDIFTAEVTGEFESIIRKAFREPGGKAMRKTIQEPDPVKPIVLKVNEVYPDTEPVTTMPPTLLGRLPVLPKELQYRIVGHALMLQDTKTNLIVDFILNAIP
jgi:hypothetical protein